MGRTKPKLIAYRRVSTARQGASGLGLEGQDAAVAAYAGQAGAVVLRADTEVETGRRADRPELARALADCTRSRATLIIARLDRLSRNTRFLLTLIESGFIGCLSNLSAWEALHKAGLFSKGFWLESVL